MEEERRSAVEGGAAGVEEARRQARAEILNSMP